MKKILLILILLFAAITLKAQQNFINVPSSEVTTKGKLFFQQQVNFNEFITSNSTLDIGLGKGFEIGMNVLGLSYETKTAHFFKNDTSDVEPFNPLVTLNAMKQFHINERLSLALGFQSGINFDSDKNKEKVALLYGNARYHDLFVKKSIFILGTYYNSQHFGGEGNRGGIWLAGEIPLSHKFHILAESIIGHNALSYSSLGIVYYLIKRMPLTFGIQIPNTQKNSYSLVFELTIVP
jgi:hypothetical protein